MPGALLNFAMLPSNCIMRMTELRKKAMATQLATIPRGRNRAMRTLWLDILPPDLRTFPAEKATPAESAERGTRRWVPWRRRLLGPPLVVQIDRWWSVAVGAAIAAADQVHRALPRHVCLPPGPLHPKAAPVAHDVLRQALCGAARRCLGQTGFSQNYGSQINRGGRFLSRRRDPFFADFPYHALFYRPEAANI